MWLNHCMDYALDSCEKRSADYLLSPLHDRTFVTEKARTWYEQMYLLKSAKFRTVWIGLIKDSSSTHLQTYIIGKSQTEPIGWCSFTWRVKMFLLIQSTPGIRVVLLTNCCSIFADWLLKSSKINVCNTVRIDMKDNSSVKPLEYCACKATFTGRKRSLRKGNDVFTHVCHSVHRGACVAGEHAW